MPDEIKKVEEVVSKKPELLLNPAGKLTNPDQEMRRIKKQAAEQQAERAQLDHIERLGRKHAR